MRQHGRYHLNDGRIVIADMKVESEEEYKT